MPLVNSDSLDAEFDICVIGSGPAGMACAFRAHDQGLKVVVLEAGGEQPIPGQPDLLATDELDRDWHDPTDIVSASALGGSSHWWGGRCVPFDPVDFRTWPLSYEDMSSWWRLSAEFLGAGGVYDTPAPGAFANLSEFSATRSECWASQYNMAKRWGARIRRGAGPAFVLHARVMSLNYEAGRIVSVTTKIGREERVVRAHHVVVACGGLGSMRLLLMAQRETPSLFGGPEGLLGRGYMGHLTGSIAELAPENLADSAGFAAIPLSGGSFSRRRLQPLTKTVIDNDLCNVAFWLESGDINEPGHGSAVGSARYLGARFLRWATFRGSLDGGGEPIGAHLATIAKSPSSAAAGLAQAAYLLLLARITGRHPRSTILAPNRRGAFPLYYHAEHLPNLANRVSLSSATDSIGLPRLNIKFRMTDQDIESVVRSHELLDQDLRAAKAGRILLKGDFNHCRELVTSAARDGYHQIGGTMMSKEANQGVVDPDCRVHGLDNLWVVSSSVFPTSSQANPTLTIVALSLRAADKIAKSFK